MTVFALMFGETITRMRFVATRFTSVSSNNFFVICLKMNPK